jgi:hypothetical protein
VSQQELRDREELVGRIADGYLGMLVKELI